ncbi:MAG: riboflavin kinase [Candidatus Buchananbacteria bacterium]
MPLIVLQGKVKTGKKQGRKLGFPTVNLKIPQLIKKNQQGIYFSLVMVNKKIYPGVTNLGPAKTFGFTKPVCETHLLNFKNDLYGQRIKILLLIKIRKIKKFSNRNLLKKQIAKDIKAAKKFFNL